VRAAILLLLSVCSAVTAYGQLVYVLPAPAVTMPAPTVDGNSPGVWVDGELRVYTSTGAQPEAMSGPGIAALQMTAQPVVTPGDHYPIWIESLWRDEDGLIYGWYHHEPGGLCGGKMTAPKIGAVVSSDGGKNFSDLGIVLESGDAVNCSAENGYFGGGHGDFSVILDRERKHFYFLFGNYGGPWWNQGVAMARMAFEDRGQPQGAVFKYANGTWTEPGIGGAVTPILAPRVGWNFADTDAFWGPAIHWNTAIERYVVLLNRSCCEKWWPQEGIYAMFGSDLSNPATWTYPLKILDKSEIGAGAGFYPQVFGTGEGETDSLAGQNPRLFVKGVSKWELHFVAPAAPVPPEGSGEEVASGAGVSPRGRGAVPSTRRRGVR
jgi:hypothetical protein